LKQRNIVTLIQIRDSLFLLLKTKSKPRRKTQQKQKYKEKYNTKQPDEYFDSQQIHEPPVALQALTKQRSFV
jgi:hypothetical protein